MLIKDKENLKDIRKAFQIPISKGCGLIGRKVSHSKCINFFEECSTTVHSLWMSPAHSTLCFDSWQQESHFGQSKHSHSRKIFLTDKWRILWKWHLSRSFFIANFYTPNVVLFSVTFNMYIKISLVVEFYRRWVLKNKI